jgi:hypothetical protein
MFRSAYHHPLARKSAWEPPRASFTRAHTYEISGFSHEQASEVVASGGEDGVGGGAVGSGEVVSAHAVLGLGVANDRFDRGAAAEFVFDGLGNAASLAGDIDLELVAGRGVVAAIAAVGNDTGKGAPICASISGITVASVWPS